MHDIISIITDLGFPMVFCFIIYKDSQKDKDKWHQALKDFGEKLDNFDNTLKGIDNRLNKLEERK